MQVNFSKMHGLGNDFVVIDAVNHAISLTGEQVRHLADRRFGIGCDQVLVVESAHGTKADFGFRIYNRDGSEAEQCGNGARCLARFLHRRKLTDKSELQLEAPTGPLILYLEPDGQVTVDMGAPRLEPDDIPFTTNQRNRSYELEVNGQALKIGAVSMGNPHAVLRVPSVASAPVMELGPGIENHPRFPCGVNVGFMEIVNRQHIQLRVFERGTGETKACGSGACAAVVVGRLQELLDPQVTVSLPGGDLVVSWAMGVKPVMMKGPATHVFEGHINL
ncbi:MAG: diaminopimelate epimerase [Gammaproteobacteria bacterium]